MDRSPYRLSVLATLFLSTLLAACAQPPAALHGNPYVAVQAPDFQVDDISGQPFHLGAQVGNIVLLYFGYTFCPDICPATVADVRWALDRMPDHADKIMFVFITVDPDRDTPERLKSYLGRFRADFIGIRVEGKTLEAIKRDYGVYAAKEADADPENYLMTHTARVFLIDQNGTLRTNYPFGTSRDDLLADLKILVEQ